MTQQMCNPCDENNDWRYVSSKVISRHDSSSDSRKHCVQWKEGFDNGAKMAGLYNGVQAHTSRANPSARFLPCAKHTLNLVCVQQYTSVTPQMVNVLGTVQSIFNFFAATKLLSVVQLTLKVHTDTRWNRWRAAAVNVLWKQITQVYGLLEDMSEDAESNTYTRSGAANFSFLISVFAYILANVVLNYWQSQQVTAK